MIFELLHLDTEGGSDAIGLSVAGGPICPLATKGAKVTYETGSDQIHIKGTATGPPGCPGGKLSSTSTVTNSESPVSID